MLHIPGDDCFVEPVKKELDPRALERSATALLGVTGMGCPTCATRVRNSLLSRPGVVWAEIDLVRGLARVHYDPDKIEKEELLQAVAEAGGDGRHRYQAMLFDSR
jgi:copper chaperone CopZ